MKKIILRYVVCFLVTLMFGVIYFPVQSSAATNIKISEQDYIEGKYKYYFAKPYTDSHTIYLCRSDKSGNNEKILYKATEKDTKEAEALEVDGHYKNKFYCSMGDYSSDCNLGIIDTKAKTIKRTKYPCVCEKISDTQYLLGDLSGGDRYIGERYFYDAKKNKFKLLAKYCDASKAVGDNIIYVKSSYNAYDWTHSATVYKYNLKNGKVSKIKKFKKLWNVEMIASNFIIYSEKLNGKFKISPFDNKVNKLSDGKYRVAKVVYIHAKDGYLDIYGQVQKSSSKKVSDYTHYKVKMSRSCKLYTIDCGTKMECDKTIFNQLHEKVSGYGSKLKGEFTVKNGMITSLTI